MPTVEDKRTMMLPHEMIAELDVIESLVNERRFQDNKWGIGWQKNKFEWLNILTEEYLEAVRAANDGDDENLRKEIIQVGALCIRMLTAMTLNKAGELAQIESLTKVLKSMIMEGMKCDEKTTGIDSVAVYDSSSPSTLPPVLLDGAGGRDIPVARPWAVSDQNAKG